MATVTIEATPSLWDRVRLRLNSWGQKIKAVVQKVGGFFARTAQWLWNSTPVQWIVDKGKFLAGKVWQYARGPVGWVAAPVAAILFAPKAVVVMLLGVGVIVGLTAMMVWPIYKEWRKLPPEERDQIFANLSAESSGGIVMTDELSVDETIASRYAYLDDQHQQAMAEQDHGLFSELTGRMFLLEVRDGATTSKVTPKASVSDVYRACKARSKEISPNFEWDWNRMINAIRNEDKRLKEVARLKAQVIDELRSEIVVPVG